MTDQKRSLDTFLDEKKDAFPFQVEKIALDISNAWRSADVGLRAFRSRPILRRFWENLTGATQERISAIGQDLLAVQRATSQIVEEIIKDNTRTNLCITKITENPMSANDGWHLICCAPK